MILGEHKDTLVDCDAPDIYGQMANMLAINEIFWTTKPCPHCTIKPVSPVSGTGSTHPHYIRFYPNGFHLVSPEIFRRVGFKQLRFIKHTYGFIADVRY